MQAAVLHNDSTDNAREVRLEERPVRPPGPWEALVKIERVGVCASDVHYFTHGRIGDFIVKKPLILGHESAGRIVSVGKGVTRFTVGDRVSLEPGIPCRRCLYCKTGRYNLCPYMTFMATPPVDGAFAEYVTWPEDFTYTIPENVSTDAAALLEPLAVGLWAVRRGGVGIGQSVAVFGAGPIGCTTLQAAKAAGATTRIAVDIEPFRLELAQKIGATHVINARAKNTLERIHDITAEASTLPLSHAGVDAAFETAGTLATCREAIQATRPGGVAVLVGLPPDPLVPLDIVHAASREVDIRGLFRYANCYPAALQLACSGAVDLDALITQRFNLSQTQEALEFADQEKASSMKVMLELDS
jgi:L-iditol 2-dehydrogenase